MRSHAKVILPSSNFKIKLAEVLKSEGYIKDYKATDGLLKSVAFQLDKVLH